MPDQETWRFINSFAPWFSAVGTTAAVIVSLYLARRSAQPKLRVSVSIMTMISPVSQPGNSAEFLQVAAVNNGFREVTLKGLAWRIGGRRSQDFIVLPPTDPYSTKLPAKLSYGDEACFRFPVRHFPELANMFLSELRKRRLRHLTLRRLRAGVFSTTGDEFWVPLDKRIRGWLNTQINQSDRI